MTIHGYPMASRGEGRDAVNSAIISGCLSGITGIILFVLVATLGSGWITEMSPLGRLALFVAAFLLIVLTEASGRILATCTLLVGVFLSVQSSGYTGGWSLPLLPSMLGLLVVPQLILQKVSNLDSQHSGEEQKSVSISACAEQLWRHKVVWTACATLGWLCGLAPGVGGTAISWMTLSVKRILSSDTSSHEDNDAAGVVAPIAGTMAKEGGSLVATLLLGIPGSTAMIIMLSALGDSVNMQSSVSPLMTTPQVVLLGVVTSLGILVASLLAPKLAYQLTRLQNLPRERVRNVSLALVIFSVAITEASISAIAILFITALLGMGMLRNGIARIPLIIGLILGADAFDLAVGVFSK
jgi:TctA family transporter